MLRNLPRYMLEMKSSHEVAEQDLEVARCVNKVTALHRKLSHLSDLTPSPIVNELFGELVALCTRTLSTRTTEKILESRSLQDIIPSLRHLCATAESHLESYWAAYIALTDDSTAAHQRLHEFPYFANYVDLTRLELSAIQTVHPSSPRKVAFIGSGPLPLSSLCLVEALSKEMTSESTLVLNIDANFKAINQSQALAKSLGSRAKGMHFLCHEAGSSSLDLREFDVVYLAALVGLTQEEKEKVLIEVVGTMREGALVVIRTAHSLRSLLYPEFDATTEAVLACLEICLAVHPYTHVVNSVVVGRVKAKGRTREKARL